VTQEILMAIKKCCIKGCERPAFVSKHELCRAHLQQYYRKGEDGLKHIRNKKDHKPYTTENKP